jgi:hypothetical protein
MLHQQHISPNKDSGVIRIKRSYESVAAGGPINEANDQSGVSQEVQNQMNNNS